jgi:hypothetical protein
MHKSNSTRVTALGAFAALCLGAAASQAAALNTADFIAACSADVSVTDDPAFDDGKVTPKTFCECVAGEFEKGGLGQQDVDMLTKMHKEEITDEDVETFPTLEDLLNTNEDFEDSCRQSLGLPTDFGPDFEDEDDMEMEGMPEEEEFPDDDGSPPE